MMRSMRKNVTGRIRILFSFIVRIRRRKSVRYKKFRYHQVQMMVGMVDKDQHPQPVLKQKPPSIQQRCNKNKAINIVILNVRTLRVKEEFTKVVKAQEQERRTRKIF